MDQGGHEFAQCRNRGPSWPVRPGAERAARRPERQRAPPWRSPPRRCFTHSRAWRAAIMPIETWSSWPAEDVIESTEAGWARVFISETSEAAVYWQTMKPELTPASPTRNGGQAVGGFRVQEPKEPAFGNGGETRRWPPPASRRRGRPADRGSCRPRGSRRSRPARPGCPTTDASSISKVSLLWRTTSRKAPCT